MIPLEIIRYVVCSFLDVKDIAALTRVCIEWKELMDNEMYGYLCERDFGIKGDWKLYKKYFSEQIGYQNFNGVHVWKPREGNQVYMRTKSTMNIPSRVIRVEGDSATLFGFYPYTLVFRREFGRWECSVEVGFVKLESVQNYSDETIIRHDWKM